MTDEKEEGLKLFASNDEVKTPEAAKFIPEGEGKNGVSPISIDHLKTKFTGLTKEELMKYANDPFWVRLRWFLFILFWLIWLLMLSAAVIIIVVEPKCPETPPPVWWKRSPLYILDVKKLAPNTTTETNVIELLKNKIDYIKSELGIESLLLKSVLESPEDRYDQIKNFTNVDRSLDNLNTFHREIIEYAKSLGVRIMLAFSPVYSGKELDQFIRSEVKEEEYRDFYVWYPTNASDPSKPPNNWLSVYDNSAWGWDDERKQFYLHQFDVNQPDLNYRNPEVIDFISNVLQFWLNLDVQGFFLNKTEYLLENKDFKDELVDGGHNGYSKNQYGFYFHTNTFELPENVGILDKWSKIIRNESGVVSVSGGILKHKEIADLVLRPIALRANFTANDLSAHIKSWISAVDCPTWEWKCSPSNSECFSDSEEYPLTIVSFLLPGVPVVYDRVEFKVSNGSSNTSDDKNSGLKTVNLIKKLNELRALPAVSHGDFKSHVINGSVFAFTRIKAGNPGYLVAWNLGNDKVTINFQIYNKTVPEDLNVVIKSSRLLQDSPESRIKESSTAVAISSKSAVVFSFVPALK